MSTLALGPAEIAAAIERLPAAERVAFRAPILRQAMRDPRWKATPVGATVRRYMRWLRNEYGATPSTIRDYESVLAQMCVLLGDKELAEVTIEDLREAIDFWSQRSARTRQKVTSVVRSFWGWCEDEGHIELSPAAKIRRPRAERRVAKVLPLDARPRLLSAAKHPRDRLGLFCLLLLGLRKDELSRIQMRDFDAQRGMLRVFGKGQKERLIPIKGPALDELRLVLLADLPHLTRPPQGDDYLLFPVDRRANGKGSEGQILWAHHARPKDKPSPNSVERWWYRQCQEAGLVGPGVKRGLNMHRARHTFAMELRRVAGLDATTQALGHSEVNTTLSIYGHQDQAELEAAFESFTAWVAEQEESRA